MHRLVYMDIYYSRYTCNRSLLLLLEVNFQKMGVFSVSGSGVSPKLVLWFVVSLFPFCVYVYGIILVFLVGEMTSI